MIENFKYKWIKDMYNEIAIGIVLEPHTEDDKAWNQATNRALYIIDKYLQGLFIKQKKKRRSSLTALTSQQAKKFVFVILKACCLC